MPTAKAKGTVMVDRPVEDVWKFVTDLSNMPKWDTVVLEMKQTSPGPLGLGATLESKHKDISVSLQVTEYEPTRRFTLDYLSGPLKGSRATLSMDNLEGRTRLSMTLDMKFSGPYKWVYKPLTLLLIPIGSRENKALVSNAKRILESEARS